MIVMKGLRDLSPFRLGSGWPGPAPSPDLRAAYARMFPGGARLWAERYNGPGNAWDGADSIAVSPSGRRVFVTGSSTGPASGEDYATVAYSG